MDNKNKIKLIKYFAIIFLPIFCIMIFGVYKELICSEKNCNNFKIKNGEYCSEHTCEWEGCTSPKGAGKTHYCYYHAEQNALNNQSEEITLTESQVSEAKQVIKEYCEDLMGKQSYILAINLINEYPEYVSEYSCSFRCNVVREDDNTNLGTIYLSINNDGSFKVDRLMLDDN